jgi:small-conductance mechanosensitive channel
MGQGLADRVAPGVRASAEHLLTTIGELLPAIAAATAVLTVFWVLAKLARRIAQLGAKYVDNPTQRNLIRQVSFYAVWAIGIVVALGVLGLDARAVATGLGLGGVALGFALKDILSNFVSGLLILLMHTFEIDDQIVVGETEGTVERIEVRATHIRTYDGRLILVPNGEIFSSRVTNNTASPLRRASVSVYLDYHQDLERALFIILDAATRAPGVAAVPTASVRLRELTPEHLHIEARVWTDSRRSDYMNTASTARIAIVNALVKDGIALPDPNQRQMTLVERR